MTRRIEDEIPCWDDLGEGARALILEIAHVFGSGMSAQVRFNVHRGGARDVRVEVDLRKVRLSLRVPRADDHRERLRADKP